MIPVQAEVALRVPLKVQVPVLLTTWYAPCSAVARLVTPDCCSARRVGDTDGVNAAEPKVTVLLFHPMSPTMISFSCLRGPSGNRPTVGSGVELVQKLVLAWSSVEAPRVELTVTVIAALALVVTVTPRSVSALLTLAECATYHLLSLSPLPSVTVGLERRYRPNRVRC